MSEKVFAQGFSFSKNPKSPEWVVGRLSLTADNAIKFIQDHTNENGFVNLNINMSQKGTYYIELDTWKPNNVAPKAGNAASNGNEDDVPF